MMSAMKIRPFLPRSDAALVRKALRDRPEAFEGLVLRQERRVRAVLLALGIRAQDLPDLVQQTFLQAFRSLSALRRGDSFGPWILQIARNQARRSHRSPPLPTVAAAPDSPAPAAPDSLEREDLRDLLWRKVGELPEEMREAIFLFYHEGESVSGVARTLGISASAVKMRLKRGRDLLRGELWTPLEDWIREMVPSARELKRSARVLSLLALAAIPAPASGAAGGRPGAAKAPAAGTTLALGGLIIMAKKLIVAAAIALLFLLGGLYVARDVREDRSGGDRGAAPAPPSPVAAVSGESVPIASLAPASAEPSGPAPETAKEEKARSIAGTVLDEEDRPIPGARISVTPKFEAVVYLEAETGDGGEFVATGLDERTYYLHVNATGYHPEWRGVLPGEQNPVVFRLKKATYLAGTVYLRDRLHPLRDGTFTFALNTFRGAGWREIKTGPQGEFTINPFDQGAHRVTFSYPAFRPINREVLLTLEKPAADLEVIFEEGLTVRGTVRNGTGEALPFADLTWRKLDAPYASRIGCRSDIQGRFEVKGLEAGSCRVVLGGPRRQDQRDREVDLGEAPLQELDLAFEVPPAVLVQVLDWQGHPAEGVTVRCDFKDPRRSGFLSRGKWYLPLTEKEGYTALNAIAEEMAITLTCEEPQSESASVSFPRTSDAPRPIVLRLLPPVPPGKLTVKVHDENGKPVAGALVVVRREGFLGQSSGTGPGGEVTLELPPGEWDVEVQPGPLPVKRFDGIAMEPGVTAEPLIVTYRKEELEHLIRGRVVNEHGNSVPQASISFHSASPEADQGASALGDANGWFIAKLANGEYAVAARTADLSTEKPLQNVRPGGPPLELRLAHAVGRSVSGTVLLDGKPCEGARLRYFISGPGKGAYRGDFNHPVCSSGDWGAFEISGFSPDLAKIVVTAQSKDFTFAHSEEIALPAEGKVEGVPVIAAEGADFELRVTDSSGRPVTEVMVRLREKDAVPPVEAEGTTDREGTWRTRRLPPGLYRLQAIRPAIRPIAEKMVEWTLAGQPVTLVFPD